MKGRWFLIFMLLITVLLFNSCINRIKDQLFPKHRTFFDERKDSNSSIVFGYIKMKGASSGLGWLTIKQYLSDLDGTQRNAGLTEVYDGYLFWDDNLKPGSYEVKDFGGNWYNTFEDEIRRYTYSFGDSPNPTAIRIKKPGVYFLGSYKFKKIKAKSIYRSDRYEINSIKSVTETMLLKKLQELAEGSKWEAMVKQRLIRIK